MSIKNTIKTTLYVLFCTLIMQNSSVAAQKHYIGKNKSVGISLSKSQIKLPILKAQIQKMALRKGVTLSNAEAQRAARQAFNKFGISRGKGPSKLIVMVSIRNFTICVSTGKDKDYCKKKR